MGCCKSTNRDNKTHPESNLDANFVAINVTAKDKVEIESKTELTPKLDEYIERQKQFELKLKTEYKIHSKMSKEEAYKPLCPSSYVNKSRRVINPFLSSTFRDFFEEREFLLKKCFPFIDKKCNEKGLNFIPIDLRWGVTADQCNSGQVIKICLDEIDNCRPYFLCFLGFRNGWSLANGNNEDKLLLKTFDYAANFYSWIYKYKNKSVTELEILYGVLLQKEKIKDLRCIFYIKSVTYLQEQITNNKSHNSYIDFDEAETNLMQLKHNIVQLEQCKVRWFDSCQELSNQVKNDVFNIIDVDFPINTQLNATNKEIYQHELFRNLLSNKIYIDVNQISSKLNSFIYKNNGKNVLIIYGDSGIGKSTILAYFDKNQRETNEQDENNLIISRYIGITIQSNNIILLLKSIINELYEKYSDLKQQINDNKQDEYDETDVYDLIDYLFKLLQKILNIYSPKFIVIIFDAINQFLYSKQALQFLNLIMNNNSHPKIKIILSASSITNINKINKNNVEIIKIDTMNTDEILMFIKHYLSQYGKVFDDKQKSMILDHEQTVCNPLFLSIFLEEMRCFGSFENLNTYMQSYINVNSISKLFEKVMCRLQNEYEKCSNILKHTLSLLYISRNGLLQNELQMCLEQMMNVSKIEKTFPIFEYTSLIHQLINLHFIRQISGKYTIIHQFINDAIHSKYFHQNDHDDNKIKYLQAIYQSFIKIYNYNNPSNQTFISQVPHCLYSLINEFNQTNYTDKLKNIIIDIECIKYMKLPQNIYDFHKYWRIIKDENTSIYKCFKLKLENLVSNNINNEYNKNQIAEYYHDIAIFMIDTGRYNDNIEYFLSECLKYYDKDTLETEAIMFELAKLYQKQNEMDKALSLNEECVQILAEKNKKNENDKEIKLRLLIRQSGLAGIQKELNQWNEAIKNYENCLKNKIELLDDKNPLIAIDMINIANTYIMSNKDKNNKYLQKAQELAFSAKKIFDINFGSDCFQLSMVYSLLGYIYQLKQDYKLAIESLETAKDIKISKLGPTNIDIVACLNNLGNVYLKMNDMQKSLTCFSNAYDLMLNNENMNKNVLISCHNNLSNYYLFNKQYDLALQHLIECKDIIREIFGCNHYKLVNPLLNLAKIYNGKIKDYESAQKFYQQILDIIDLSTNSFNYVNIKLECLNGLSHLYLCYHKNYDKSIEYLDKQLLIIKELSSKEQQIDILHDKVGVFIAQNNFVSAWSILQQILTILNNNNAENNKLITTYNICGNVMFQLNRQNDAIEYYEKQLRLMKPQQNEKKFSHQCLDLIQLLAILHFGNQNLIQSKKYFELYMETCDTVDTKEINMWMNEIQQAQTLLTV